MILPTFTPRSTWTAPSLSSLPRWEGCPRVAVDIETCDPTLKQLGPGVRRGGYIVGVSFAIEDGPSHYLPMRHAGGGNLPVEGVLGYLNAQAKVFRGDLVGANIPYDLDFLAEAGIKFNPRFFRDVQIAEPLLDELQFSYSLDNIAARRKFPGKAEDHLRAAAAALGIDPKADLWRLPAAHVGAYAEQDARLPLQILRQQERQLEEEGLWEVYDLESRLLPVLLKMKRRGVAVDFNELARIEAWSHAEELAALKELHRLTGIHLTQEDTTRTAALIPVVKYMGVEIPKTDAGNDSLTKGFLDTLAGPIGGLINRARRFNKLRGSFVDSRRAHAVNGRIHPTFHQLRSEKPGQDDDGGARYGRLSCSDPNLQQEPANDEEIGPRWRRVYPADEGGEWACLDYSQQEPRWAVHCAEALKEPGAKEAGDRYRQDPTTDNHDMMTILIHGQAAWDGWDKATRKHFRNHAKRIFLGLCYGMGGAKLARDLGLPTIWVPSRRLGKMVEVAGEEAQKILDMFDAKVPFIRRTAKRAEKFARSHGFIRTVLGRKCRFPRNSNGEVEWSHKAFNRFVQGSSGDQTKQAMVDADTAGIRLQLQVHDELDLTIWDRTTAQTLAGIMRSAVQCSVPHNVDLEIGPNWGEIKKVAA